MHVRAVSGSVLVHVRVRVRVQGRYWDGYTGWVYRGSTTQPPREEPNEEVPTRSSLLRWVLGVLGGGNACSGVRRRGRLLYHPTGPVSPPVGFPVQDLAECRLWAIGRDLTSFLRNLVKTRKCHQNVSKRPPIVPNRQNGSQKSPLDILGFPI